MVYEASYKMSTHKYLATLYKIYSPGICGLILSGCFSITSHKTKTDNIQKLKEGKKLQHLYTTHKLP